MINAIIIVYRPSTFCVGNLSNIVFSQMISFYFVAYSFERTPKM